MSVIKLNVVSENNQNCTSYESIFDTSNMAGIQANQNTATTPTFTEAGDIQGIFTLWNLTSDSGKIFENQIVYWTLTNVATVRTVRIYSNATRTALVAEGTRTIANGANATIWLREANESGIYGSVLCTIAGGGAVDDTDVANTITITNIAANSDLELAGATEFVYVEPDERKVKYTVTETPAQILALADGYEVFTGEAVGIIDFATTGAVTGASYAVERADGAGELTIPTGAVIMNAWYNVNTTFTSATNAATIAIGVETDDATGIVAATAIGAVGNVWNAGIHQAVPDYATVADYTTAATAERRIIYTLGAAEDLTAGRLHLHIAYAVMV